MGRFLAPSTALLWGLQYAFLNPALALLLVALYDATPGQVGTVLALYNAGGLVASLVIPAWADRRGDYLSPMLVCAALTIALTAALASTGSLPVAVVALVVLGGPAGVGSTLLFAHLNHSGASSRDVVNTRAIVSFAWVAGPPVAAFLIGTLGEVSVLVAVGSVAVLVATATLALRRQRTTAAVGPAVVGGGGARTPGAAPDGEAGSRPGQEPDPTPVPGSRPAMPRSQIAVLVAVFVVLQATNSAAVAATGLFVTVTVGLDVVWAGIVLGVAAAVEIPALLVVGRLSLRVPHTRLLLSGCLAGAVYYAAMSAASAPWMLLALQVFNAWFFAVVAGIGLTLFQRVIPRPGLASGLYANTRRLGAIAAGGLLALGSVTTLGYAGVFLACAALTLAALLVLRVTATGSRSTTDVPGGP